MPELPEVETICRDLSKKIIGKQIDRVTIKKPRLVKSGVAQFKKVLTGNKFTDIRRRGKLLYLKLQTSEFLLVHLKMTGQLIYQQDAKIIAGGHSYSSFDFTLPNGYSYIIFSFVGDGELFFNDMRTFGYMQLVDAAQLESILSTYGIEPLQKDFTVKNFQQSLGKRQTNIKALLLNQNVIAGIGNIYADEICFYAGVRPIRPVNALSAVEIKKLWQGANIIIKKAIRERGTTFNSFRDGEGNTGNFLAHLQVFGRQKQPCKRCQTGIIVKTKVAGRGTHYCPACQT